MAAAEGAETRRRRRQLSAALRRRPAAGRRGRSPGRGQGRARSSWDSDIRSWTSSLGLWATGSGENRLGLPDLGPPTVEIEDSTFARSFRVATGDERRARRILDDGVRRRLLRNAGSRLHVAGSQFFLHREELLDNDELSGLLSLAAELASELEAAGRGRSAL